MTQTSNDRKVPTRRMAFEPDLAQVPRHFAADGDVLTSHFWALLSATFPEGEELFVRSVRHYRDQITDPVLKRQVAGFIGQEAMHAKEHRAFNDRLEQLGYPVQLVENIEKWVNKLRERVLTPEMNLAVTVVAEHFTALLAEEILATESFRRSLGHEAVTNIYTWHALEESEHKAVAFDVYRACGLSERKRVWTMKVVRLNLPSMLMLLILHALITDSAARRPNTLRRSIRRLRALSLFRKEVWEAIKDFERPDFHPDQRDTDALLSMWRETLFGDQGTLNTQLVAGTTAI